MNPLEFFTWLCWQMIVICLVLNPGLAVPALAGLIWACVELVRTWSNARAQSLWLFPPFVIPFLILVIATVFEGKEEAVAIMPWPVLVVYALAISHLAIGVAQALILDRLTAPIKLGFNTFQAWMSYCAAWLANSAITNVWP